MNHAHVKDISLFLILRDSFSGWPPEVIKVTDRNATTIKQVSINGVPKTIVIDNVPEFCDENLCSGLKRIGYIPYKTPP